MVVGHAADDRNKSESPAAEKNYRGPVYMKCYVADKYSIYGGPQVHTEFQKVTPNSNNSHRIQITHTEFK